MKYVNYLKSALLNAVLTGFALGLIFLGLTLGGFTFNGHIDLELHTSPVDALLSLVLLPAVFFLLALLASPVVGLLLFLQRRFRKQLPAD